MHTLKGHYRMMHYALRLPHLVLGYSVPLPLPNIVAILIYGITNLTCSTKAGTGYQLHKHQHQLCTCKWKLAGAKAHGFFGASIHAACI